MPTAPALLGKNNREEEEGTWDKTRREKAKETGGEELEEKFKK